MATSDQAKQVRGVFDKEAITFYQAYRPEITIPAIGIKNLFLPSSWII